RSQVSMKDSPAEAVADWILAQRVRRQVIEICQTELKALPAVGAGMTADEKAEVLSRRDWILATPQEGAVGLRDATPPDGTRRAAERTPAAGRLESPEQQIARLRTLLAQPPMKAAGIA